MMTNGFLMTNVTGHRNPQEFGHLGRPGLGGSQGSRRRASVAEPPRRPQGPLPATLPNSYDDHAADLLYKVINPRYEECRSLLVSTNLAFKDWNRIFPNATCIVTLIDRHPPRLSL